MDSLKKSLRYQFMETKKFIMKFWITLILVNILFYILNSLGTGSLMGFDSNSVDFSIGFSIGTSEYGNPISVVGINLIIIFITLIVYNYERNYESFPLSLSLGMTRRDYFTSFLIDNIVVVSIFSIIQGVLLKIDPTIMKLVGKDPLYEFINFNLQTDNILYIIFTLFILFLAFISFFNFLASLNYRFGYKLWILIVGLPIIISTLKIKFLLSLVKTIYKYFEKIIVTRFGVYESLVILISVAVIYILNYFVTINSDVKRKTL